MLRGGLWMIGIMVSGFLIAAAIICGIGMQSDIRPSAVAIVLGSKIEADGSPSVHLRLRLERTLALYQAGLVPCIIVSGGPGVPEHPEPEVMRDFLVAQGVPAKAIILDAQGINTAATARNAQRLMQQYGFASAMVITEYFHIPRTRLAFSQQGIEEVRYASVGYPLPRDLLAIGRETLGLPLYWLGMRQTATIAP